MFRRALMLSTILRNKPDDAGGAAAVAAVPAAEAAPAAVVEPAVAAVAEAAPAAVVDAPAADSAPAPEAEKPVEGAPAAEPEKPASLLSAAERTAADKAAAAAAVVEAPKPDAEAAPAPVVEVEPVKYEFKLPENVKVEAEAMGAFTSVLSEHKITPEVGQSLMDLYLAESAKMAAHSLSEQHRVFNEMTADWVKQSMADPEIGGNSHETAMQDVAAVRDALFQGDELKQFNDLLDSTGVGNHPLMLKGFKRMARFLKEPAAPSITASPAPNRGQKPGKQGMQSVYTHPSSQPAQS